MATGTISSVGIGTSGLDVSSIITKLVDLEKAPLTGLQAEATNITTKITAYSQIKSLASTLSDAAFNLSLSTSWKAVSTTSSNTSAVQVAASGNSIASANSFSMTVEKLAKAQSAATDSFASTAAVGAGTMQIQLGTWDTSGATPAFTAGAAGAVSVSIAATDTISDVAAKINAAGAGVSATVVTDTSGQRLLIRSNATGEAAGFRIQTTETADDSDNTTGLSRLTFDPQNGAYGLASSANASSIQYGQNAKATINGISVSSTSNTFTDTIPGLALTVSAETSTAVDVTVAADTTTMAKSVQTFVDAYNAFNTFITENTKYDATNKQGTLLQGDSAAIGMQNLLRTAIGSVTGGSGAFSRISDIGVSIQQDGSLYVDSTKLNTALKDNASIVNLFTADTGDTQTSGFGVKLKALMAGMLNTGGTITNKTDSLTVQQKRNTDEQTAVNDHVTVVQDRLNKTYTALDTQMASLSALSAYVTQQVTLWNKSTG